MRYFSGYRFALKAGGFEQLRVFPEGYSYDATFIFINRGVAIAAPPSKNIWLVHEFAVYI